MDIVLIGSGNTASVLGRKSYAAGHRILQVYSRRENHASLLANRLDADPVSSISSIVRKSDLMIIALPDQAVAPFVQSLGKTKSIVTHTAGALSIHDVSGISELYGVLYPLQSLRKEIESIPPFTMLVDGNDNGTRDRLYTFASTLTETVMAADDDTRLKYHLAATLVNNFTNHLFAIAELFCEKENISFAVLQPLMEETVMRLRKMSPGNTQTGPAFRNDLVTLQKHRDLLNKYPSILKLYDLFTDEIQKSGPGFPRLH